MLGFVVYIRNGMQSLSLRVMFRLKLDKQFLIKHPQQCMRVCFFFPAKIQQNFIPKKKERENTFPIIVSIETFKSHNVSSSIEGSSWK